MTQNSNGLEIAIIGMSLRFPGANNIDQFWENLRDGVGSISFFTEEELSSSGVAPSLLTNPNYVKAYGALEGVELFDASFFGLNPREAEITDPQHRLFLECAWEALENAGYDSENYAGSIGIYAGSGANRYLINVLESIKNVETRDIFFTSIGSDKDFLTTRVSYKMNLTGPSVTLQTACSTSLVAVHMASQALLAGACDMCLAGGVTVRPRQKAGYTYQEGGIFSRDGRCLAFDANATGTVPGSGVGIVVLKRLHDALEDSDHIYAVIKGSAINNDGAGKIGYTAPGVRGQANVIRSAHVVAEVEPETITYIEAHGTGTQLGDAIELSALAEVFSAASRKMRFCAVGSVKTNIGHLDTAAGIAGLIKTALALKNRMIPPVIHFEQANPTIDLEKSPFSFNTELMEWKSKGAVRRAGISSFGIGGTNAHVILEEAPQIQPSGPSWSRHLLILSAKSEPALEEATKNLSQFLKQHRDVNLADVSYTLQLGRRSFDFRRILMCRDLEDAIAALDATDQSRMTTRFQKPRSPQVVFMFPGQGTQYRGMAEELYLHEAVFREQVDLCAEILKRRSEIDLYSVLFPTHSRKGEPTPDLKQTSVAQPALFVIEYALSRLLMGWGIRPQAMIGHSLGEYVAACLSGIWSLEDALWLVSSRGRLMQDLPEGAMLSVSLSEDELWRLLTRPELTVAATNSPISSVVSGPVPAIEALQKDLIGKGIACRRLQTSHAFHSPMMDPILEPFAELARKTEFRPPQIPYISNLDGMWISDKSAQDAHWWTRHLRQTVRFTEGLSKILARPDVVLIEVGPGKTLSNLAKQHVEEGSEPMAISTLAGPGQSDVESMLQTLGRAWLADIKVSWPGVYCRQRRNRVPLPTYPFERQRFWIDEPSTPQMADNYPRHESQGGANIRMPLSSGPSTEFHYETADSPSPSQLPGSDASTDYAGATWDANTGEAGAVLGPVIRQQLELMSLQLRALQEEVAETEGHYERRASHTWYGSAQT